MPFFDISEYKGLVLQGNGIERIYAQDRGASDKIKIELTRANTHPSGTLKTIRLSVDQALASILFCSRYL